MAKIKLSELRPAGSELLQDSESFLNELSDRELENVVGGHTINSVASQNSISVASEVKGGLNVYFGSSDFSVV
ncbi:MAG: bacteriocin [Pleurocapsa sp. MO_192.B19]|nr:bacteriocin [Pleurocapsa sp. MO_192.B19]